MKTIKTKFEDFETEKLSKKAQKVVRGGDGPIDPHDPGKWSSGNGIEGQ
ncbi:rSAM-modified peptide [Flavobacterium daemonense]|nr:rSAM-modified peptide [Flavobacterium daemonense]KAF2336211.1 rSAM-modified peptide [Flavobacterium daemonense]